MSNSSDLVKTHTERVELEKDISCRAYYNYIRDILWAHLIDHDVHFDIDIAVIESAVYKYSTYGIYVKMGPRQLSKSAIIAAHIILGDNKPCEYCVMEPGGGLNYD